MTYTVSVTEHQRFCDAHDASEWRGKYDGLKDAYDHNRAVKFHY